MAPAPSIDPNKENLNDEISDLDDNELIQIKWNCNQVRTRINTYINNTSTTLKDFQKKLDVSDKSYRSFMQQSGPHAGAGNNTYLAAHQFFSKREAAGLKMPRAPAAKKKTAKSDENDKYDVSDIHLDGEQEGSVPVFDTCNDVRTKISRHMRTSNMTQAAFARAISACQGEHSTPIQAKLVTDFTSKGKRGPMSGNTSKAFYASYVYFEKLRIKEGKKKSKKREEMEREYGADGVDRVRVSENVGVWCLASERPYITNTGRLEIV